MWRRAWVSAVDHQGRRAPGFFHLMQDRATGLLIQGTREWRDYTVSVAACPHMTPSGGLAARVQGLRRYYALLLADNGHAARLVKVYDGPPRRWPRRTSAGRSTRPIAWN